MDENISTSPIILIIIAGFLLLLVGGWAFDVWEYANFCDERKDFVGSHILVNDELVVECKRILTSAGKILINGSLHTQIEISEVYYKVIE